MPGSLCGEVDSEGREGRRFQISSKCSRGDIMFQPNIDVFVRMCACLVLLQSCYSSEEEIGWCVFFPTVVLFVVGHFKITSLIRTQSTTG